MYLPIIELCSVISLECALVINKSKETEDFKSCEVFMNNPIDNKLLLRFLASKHLKIEYGTKFTYQSYCIEGTDLEEFMEQEQYKVIDPKFIDT